jgi:hypothetical protein
LKWVACNALACIADVDKLIRLLGSISGFISITIEVVDARLQALLSALKLGQLCFDLRGFGGGRGGLDGAEAGN